MGRGERLGATQPQSGHRRPELTPALNANGTGPFMHRPSHQAGVKTVFKPNPNWWGKPEHNLDEVDLHHHRRTTRRASRRCSRARSTWIDPVPLQDIERIKCERQRHR